VARKGRPEALKDVYVTADVKNQWISYSPSSVRACVATVTNAGAESSSRSEKRRALCRELDGTEIREPVAATINIADIHLS
jgi:hypothetical protein